MRSALYKGRVQHTRLDPRPHAFGYRVVLLYLDLDELPDLLPDSKLWSAERPAPVWFRRADYMGPTDVPLRQAVLDRVEAELGRRPSGPVRVLTQARTLGYLFNPVSFYYGFDDAGELDFVAAEITNTPWRERHTYVLDARRQGAGDELRARFAKSFHVSPFFDMAQDYDWRFSAPDERLRVHMTSLEGGAPVFHAGLECRREALTPASLRRAFLRAPLQTFGVHAAIYLQAALLRLKGIPFHVHPDKRVPQGGAARP